MNTVVPSWPTCKSPASGKELQHRTSLAKTPPAFGVSNPICFSICAPSLPPLGPWFCRGACEAVWFTDWLAHGKSTLLLSFVFGELLNLTGLCGEGSILIVPVVQSEGSRGWGGWAGGCRLEPRLWPVASGELLCSLSCWLSSLIFTTLMGNGELHTSF